MKALVSAVLSVFLISAATPVAAEWYRLRPPHDRYYRFDASAPLTLWFQEMQESGHADKFTFYTERECQKDRSGWVDDW